MFRVSISNYVYKLIDFDFVGLCFAPVLRLPQPQGERRTDDPEEIGRGARRSQNQFTLPGVGVNKLIFFAPLWVGVNEENQLNYLVDS
jgi:hypothetical protein